MAHGYPGGPMQGRRAMQHEYGVPSAAPYAAPFSMPSEQQQAVPYSQLAPQHNPLPYNIHSHMAPSSSHDAQLMQQPINAQLMQQPVDGQWMQQPVGKPPLPSSMAPPPSAPIPSSRLPAHRSATPLLPQQPLPQHFQQHQLPASAPPVVYHSPAPPTPLVQPAYPFPVSADLPPPLPSTALHSRPQQFPPSSASEAAAAGAYRRDDPDAPRIGIGRGQYNICSESYSSRNSNPYHHGPGVRGVDGLAAKQHNADSLEHYMGGLGGGKGENRSHYGNAHAGKISLSHLQACGNGMEGPSDGLARMQGMRHFHDQGLHGKLQASDVGLVGGSEKPIGRRHIPGKSNLQFGPEGLSSSKDGVDFLSGFRHGGPHRNSNSHVVQRDGGIVQGGEAPQRYNPHAGKISESHLSNGSYAPKPLVSPDGQPLVARPRAFAGKRSEACISYDAGTLTVSEPAEAVRPRNRGDPARWGTTYDQWSGARA
ncbi:hypothetical protein DUNSADRAFT_2163 [Dunaliella salina]|uniref:Uncharacterized protein n=1 Tax=Dunaliella salina TaxID=3046 RepID=A0ABQ7H8F0_DUNSA|nr:hypothetical protein DUNSADRAFT_2163 [Dunaliella salina]|eukprot:KAF5843126.1 hypothetical protein DUNSADRAFT_2163 [Dunaliella salina]